MNINEHERKYLIFIDNISPIEFLTAKKDGKPSRYDLIALEELLLEIKLPSGVLNVVIDYALQRNNNRFTKNYVATIARSLEQEGISNVEQAFIHFKKEVIKRKYANYYPKK